MKDTITNILLDKKIRTKSAIQIEFEKQASATPWISHMEPDSYDKQNSKEKSKQLSASKK